MFCYCCLDFIFGNNRMIIGALRLIRHVLNKQSQRPAANARDTQHHTTVNSESEKDITQSIASLREKLARIIPDKTLYDSMMNTLDHIESAHGRGIDKDKFIDRYVTSTIEEKNLTHYALNYIFQNINESHSLYNEKNQETLGHINRMHESEKKYNESRKNFAAQLNNTLLEHPDAIDAARHF